MIENSFFGESGLAMEPIIQRNRTLPYIKCAQTEIGQLSIGATLTRSCTEKAIGIDGINALSRFISLRLEAAEQKLF